MHSRIVRVQILRESRSGGPVRVKVDADLMVGLEGVEPPA